MYMGRSKSRLFLGCARRRSGLFAVATRYHLKLYPLPKSITSSLYYYAYDDMESVSNWLGTLASKLPNSVELSFGFDMPLSKNTYYDFGV